MLNFEYSNLSICFRRLSKYLHFIWCENKRKIFTRNYPMKIWAHTRKQRTKTRTQTPPADTMNECGVLFTQTDGGTMLYAAANEESRFFCLVAMAAVIRFY